MKRALPWLGMALFAVVACSGSGGGTGGGSGGSGGGGGGSGGGSGDAGTCSNQPFTPVCSCDYSSGGTGGLGNCDVFSLQAMDNNTADGGAEMVCQPNDAGPDSCGGDIVASCPTSNLVGTCWSPSGLGGGTRYYSPTYTAATALADCQSAIRNGGCFQTP